MQDFIKNKLTLWLSAVVFCLGLSLGWGQGASAVSLHIVSDKTHLVPGEEVIATVYIDTETDSVNAIAGVLLIPDGFSFLRIDGGGSVVSYWVESPKAPTAAIVKGSYQIPFSGVLPGGLSMNRGNLFSVALIVSTTNYSAKLALSFAKVIVLKNDGLGTPASTTVRELAFSVFPAPVVMSSSAPTSVPPVVDITPPEQFTPAISRNMALYNNQYFMVFLTQDLESGVDHYEVQESLTSESGNNWQEAKSPYLVRDQSLRRYFFVKAVDRQGNSRIAVVVPKKQVGTYQGYIIWCIIAAASVLVIFVYIFRKKRAPPALNHTN